jgi:hypothetical protein
MTTLADFVQDGIVRNPLTGALFAVTMPQASKLADLINRMGWPHFMYLEKPEGNLMTRFPHMFICILPDGSSHS